MFPTSIKGKILSFLTIIRNLCEFITNFLFLISINSINAGITFSFFSLICLFSLYFIKRYIIETKYKDSNIILNELLQLYKSYYNYYYFQSNSENNSANSRNISVNSQRNSDLELNRTQNNSQNSINNPILYENEIIIN